MPRQMEFTTVRPRAGGLVHATTIAGPGKTLCSKKCDGWVVVPGVAVGRRVVPAPLNCDACLAAVVGQTPAAVHAARGGRK